MRGIVSLYAAQSDPDQPLHEVGQSPLLLDQHGMGEYGHSAGGADEFDALAGSDAF